MVFFTCSASRKTFETKARLVWLGGHFDTLPSKLAAFSKNPEREEYRGNGAERNFFAHSRRSPQGSYRNWTRRSRERLPNVSSSRIEKSRVACGSTGLIASSIWRLGNGVWISN